MTAFNISIALSAKTFFSGWAQDFKRIIHAEHNWLPTCCFAGCQPAYPSHHQTRCLNSRI